MTVALSTARLNGTLVPAPAGGSMNSARPPASAIDDETFILVPADLTSLFQPIMSFASGRIEGFETLARLRVGEALLQPPHIPAGSWPSRVHRPVRGDAPTGG